MTQRTDRRNNPPTDPSVDGYTHVDTTPNPDVLPDILNSHLPYTSLPSSSSRRLPPPAHPPPPPPLPYRTPVYVPARPSIAHFPYSSTEEALQRGMNGFRPLLSRGRNRSSTRGIIHIVTETSERDEPKHCCGVAFTQTVSIRWFIIMIAFVGVCCAIVGTVLGALRATGQEHLTVSLLMIGVGIVLVTVSGIAWKMTSHDAPSCRAMLGLQSDNPEPNRRFMPRVPPFGRPLHPFGAMMYPEFQHRPLPPSYQASMQEYRLRLLLLDRQQGAAPSSSTVSPPPTYRSHPSTLQRQPLNLVERENSRPPSYRSRTSTGGPLRASSDTLESRQNGSGAIQADTSHSPNASLSLSFLSHESLFVDSCHSRPTDLTVSSQTAQTVTTPSGQDRNCANRSSLVTQMGSQISTNQTVCNRNEQNIRKSMDVNRVTIVQTTDSSQVVTQDAVIVSVNGSPVAPSSANHGDVQILAHV
ncbi:uncharacterized protein LOC143255238 [Tachypleus tridentatus]|uniref:uncharacterized protein LOC143255238 n=1 Tax=Tachypleus tridentatus TaxID=6853 RepID=UPI003FD41F55